MICYLQKLKDIYLRNCFAQKNEKSIHEYFGAITDGKYKLDVLVVKKENEDINFTQGSKLDLLGDLQENGLNFILKIKNLDNIKLLPDDKMEINKLLLGSEIHLIQVILRFTLIIVIIVINIEIMKKYNFILE